MSGPTVPPASGAQVAPPPAEDQVQPADEEATSPAWSDEAAESEYRAEARNRGELVRENREVSEVPEETEAGALPDLDELVARLPAEVRETLEDLFRARFVAVKRVPRKALKG